MMPGLLLARAGGAATVLKKHDDFLRSFRADTPPLHLEPAGPAGTARNVHSDPQNSITTLDVVVGGARLSPVNFGTLRGSSKRISLMSQWDFLELLAAEGRKLANFHLLMGTLATLAAKAVPPVTARIAGRRFLPEKLHRERPRKLRT